MTDPMLFIRPTPRNASRPVLGPPSHPEGLPDPSSISGCGCPLRSRARAGGNRCSQARAGFVDPPADVLVVSIDEKTGIQAKAPTKPEVAPRPDRPARREHECTRNATQCLFAALKVHHGEAVAMASTTRNRFDLIRFLDHLASEIPALTDHKIVAISDNLSMRGTQEVQDWLKTHPRWSFPFTPTHASWLNQVEIFFSILVRHLLKHGTFTSEEDLATQMLAYVETYNQTAKPFKWTCAGKTLEAWINS